MGQQPLARRRGLHAGLGTQQQRLAHLLLQLAHLLAHGRLREAHTRRRRRETARFHHGHQGAEPFQVEGTHVLSNGSVNDNHPLFPLFENIRKPKNHRTIHPPGALSCPTP